MTVRTKEEMSPAYRDMVIRLMTRQLYAETATAEVFGQAIALAPTWREKYMQAQFAREEAEHSDILMRLLADLGVDGEAVLTQRPPASRFWGLEGGIQSWLDVAVFNFLVDRAGSWQIMLYRQGSYDPWATAMEAVLRDEEGHYGMGVQTLQTLCAEPQVRQQAQELVDRLLPMTIKRAFGRPDAAENAFCLEVGLKPKPTQEVQAGYLREMQSHMERCGLRFPPLRTFAAQGVELGEEARQYIAACSEER